jgi:hypothetical protein
VPDGLRIRTIALAAVLAVAVAGCGADATEHGDVTKTVRGWTDALSRGDGGQACSRMTGAAAHELAVFGQAYGVLRPTGDCSSNVRAMAYKLNGNAKRQMHDADVDDIRIEGPVATVHMAGGGPNEIVLRRQGGKWRIDQAFRHGWRLVGAPSFGMTGG